MTETSTVSGQPSTGGSYSEGTPNWVPTGWAWVHCAVRSCPSIHWVAPWARLAGWETYVCSPACAGVYGKRSTVVSPPDPRGPVVPPRTVL